MKAHFVRSGNTKKEILDTMFNRIVEIDYCYSGFESMDNKEYAMNRESMAEAIHDVDEKCNIKVKKDGVFGSGTIIINNTVLSPGECIKALEDYVDGNSGWKLTYSYDFEISDFRG